MALPLRGARWGAAAGMVAVWLAAGPVPGTVTAAEPRPAAEVDLPADEVRYEQLAEEFRALRDDAEGRADRVLLAEADALAEIAEELVQEDQVDVALELLTAAVALLRPDPEQG